MGHGVVKMKAQKAKRLQNARPVSALHKEFVWKFHLQESKNKESERPKGQNERKWKPKRPKWKEMKAQKAKTKGNESPNKPKMKGNEGTKGQNEKKWRPKRPKWKEMMAQKDKNCKMQSVAALIKFV